MALLCVGGAANTKKRFIAASSGAKISIAEECDNETQNVVLKILTAASDNNESVVAMTVGCQGQLLAVCTSEKRLVVWECNEWSVKCDRMVPKRVTSIQFSEKSEFLLTADKTGEVIRYNMLSDMSAQGEVILGHLSMILDMVLVPHDSHVITCDRDEKIRVSKYPNSYNIETFCLGHTEFVICISLCERWPHILISSSGDGTLKSWDWKSGQLLDTHQCSLGEVPTVVTHVVCSKQRVEPLVIASMEGVTELIAFHLLDDGKFEHLSTRIPLQVSPWSFAFDWSDRLWVCLADKQDPVQCWEYSNNEFQKCPSPLQKQLSHWELFKDCGETRDSSELQKQTFDNMADYLARKEERIRQKKTHPDNDNIPLPPPEKKSKLHPLLS